MNNEIYREAIQLIHEIVKRANRHIEETPESNEEVLVKSQTPKISWRIPFAKLEHDLTKAHAFDEIQEVMAQLHRSL